MQAGKAATIAAIAMGALGLAAQPAVAGTVTSSGDAGANTLRGQIDTALDGDTITIAPSINPVLSSGQIQFDKSLTIEGQGPAATTVDANLTSRIFDLIGDGNTVTIRNLTLAEGRAPNGMDNIGGGGGAGGNGGAIQSTADFFTLQNVVIRDSQAGIGGGGDSGGFGGDGGGLFLLGDDERTLDNVVLRGNIAGSGGVGAAGNGGSGGNGGGMGGNFVSGEFSNLTVVDNHAGDGGSGTPDGGDGGDGGGLAPGAGGGAVVNSTFAENSSGDGGTAFGGAGGDAGGGSAIYVTGFVLMENITVTGNRVGQLGIGGGGTSTGAAIGATGASDYDLLNATIADNTAPAGIPVAYHLTGAAETIHRTLLVDNVAGGATVNNCPPGTPSGESFNLAFPADADCPENSLGNPLLGGLASNGGPTQTMALPPGSAAIDRIPVGECGGVHIANVDQRGVARPIGPACDIGAFEGPSPAGGSVVTPLTPPETPPRPKCRKKKKKGKSAVAAAQGKKKKKCKKRKKR